MFWQYDYASGDQNPTDGTHGTFDTMYPTAHDRFGITDQFGWQNIITERAGLTIEPRHRWTITGQDLDFWLASATDALYNTSGGVIVRDATGKSGTHVGYELDTYTWYELNRHDGNIEQVGTPDEVCRRPANAFVEEFLRDVNPRRLAIRIAKRDPD